MSVSRTYSKAKIARLDAIEIVKRNGVRNHFLLHVALASVAER